MVMGSLDIVEGWRASEEVGSNSILTPSPSSFLPFLLTPPSRPLSPQPSNFLPPLISLQPLLV